jgi:hypothetical protein
VAYDFDRIDGGTRYRELDGWRQSLKLADRFAVGAGRLALGYRLELNRRRDFSRAPEFFSTSPARHRAFAESEWRLTDAVSAHVDLEYERSRYRDPDRRLQGPTLVTGTRVDRRLTGELGVGFEIARGWRVAVDYRYLDRQSTVPSHAYVSNRFELGLSHRFP